MDKTTEALLDASVGDFAETGGASKKPVGKKAPVAGLGGLDLPKQEKKPPAGLAGATLAPSKEKKKKKKGSTSGVAGGEPFAMNPFGFGGGFGGGGGGGLSLPGGAADPFADVLGGGGGGWAPPLLTPELQARQAREIEKQMNAFNEQMTQMFKDIPPPDPNAQSAAQASLAETIRQLSGQASADASANRVNEDGSTKSLSAEEAAMKQMFEAMSAGMGGIGANGTRDGEAGDSSKNPMQTMMDTMLQHLLSKDVLYEPMKEMAEKYPSWLKKNGKKIPDDELFRFEAQLVKTKAIIAAFEDDTVEHSEIVRLLQEMQSLGNPPDEIMREMANKNGMRLGPNGVPEAWANLGSGGGGGGDASASASAPAGLGGLGLGKTKKGGSRSQGGPPPECSIM